MITVSHENAVLSPLKASYTLYFEKGQLGDKISNLKYFLFLRKLYHLMSILRMIKKYFPSQNAHLYAIFMYNICGKTT